MKQSQPFFKRPRVKIILLTLLFILILAVGAIPVWVVFNMDQTLFIRILIGLSGPVWAIMTVLMIALRTDYTKQWQTLSKERKRHNMHTERSINPEYQALYEKFPLSISSYERHWRHHPDGRTFDELMDSALTISEEEWQKREDFRRENRAERHTQDTPHSDSLAPSRQHSHHHHDDDK